MRSFALTLVAWVLTSACSLAGPGSPSEDVLARGPTAAAAPPPIAAGQHRPPTAVTTITCRSRTDCEPEQVCVATRPGISECLERRDVDRKSTRLNSSHSQISYAVFCLKKK